MPRTILPNPALSPRYAGLVTFGRYPRLEDVTPQNRPVDWIFFGAPYDGGVTYRPGTRFGPRAIREQSQYLKHYHIVHGIDVPAALSLADAGDAPVRAYDCKDNAETIAAFARALPDPGISKPFMLGGDHSITLGALRAAYERAGKPSGGLALLHADSHLDTMDETLGERYSHASPFIRAIEEGILNPKLMVSVGIKGPVNTAGEFDYARDHGVTVITGDQYRANGLSPAKKVLESLAGTPTYFTFDIDVVDPVFAPGTGTPSVGGLTSAEALHLVRSFAPYKPKLVGADLVEVLPDRDVAGNTALLAAHIAFEIIALDAIRKPR